MPTDLPIAPRRRPRQPWPGQGLCFALVAIGSLPLIILAKGVALLLLWLHPDPPD